MLTARNQRGAPGSVGGLDRVGSSPASSAFHHWLSRSGTRRAVPGAAYRLPSLGIAFAQHTSPIAAASSTSPAATPSSGAAVRSGSPTTTASAGGCGAEDAGPSAGPPPEPGAGATAG